MGSRTRWYVQFGYSLWGFVVKTAISAYLGKERRRSSRVPRPVELKVLGVDSEGLPFEEPTATLDISFHGCRLFSKHGVKEKALLTLEFSDRDPTSKPSRVRARATWCRASAKLKGLFQIGLELDTPGHLWGIPDPPADWLVYPQTDGSDQSDFQRDLNAHLDLAAKGTYYQLLGVTALATKPEIKRNYYQLARRFHPDHHTSHPELGGPLRKLMEALALAYKTLGEENSRKDYDKRLAKSGAFSLSREKTEGQKSAEECLNRAKECLRAKNYAGSILWLRECVGVEPNSSKYHSLLARSLAAVRQYRREAIGHFQKAIDLDPWNVTAYFHLAELFTEMQLPWRALALYQKVLEIDPGNDKACEQLRLLGSAAGKHEHGDAGFLDRFLHRAAK